MTDKYTFDEARAKAGHPVQFSRGSMDGSTPQEWVDVHYIGRDVVRGGHIVQFKEGDTISTGALRMAPVFRKVFVNLFPGCVAAHYDSVQAAIAGAQHARPDPIAIAVPVEFEISEGRNLIPDPKPLARP